MVANDSMPPQPLVVIFSLNLADSVVNVLVVSYDPDPDPNCAVVEIALEMLAPGPDYSETCSANRDTCAQIRVERMAAVRETLKMDSVVLSLLGVFVVRHQMMLVLLLDDADSVHRFQLNHRTVCVWTTMLLY